MKRKTMGWLIVFLLFIVYMLNYMDRSALSITAPLIEKELGFNAAEMGMVCILWLNWFSHRIVDNAYRARSFRYG